MKVILRENIDSLGRTGDIVKVSEGYARNFLLPRKMVLIADEKNMRELEHHKGVLGRKRAKENGVAKEIAGRLEKFSCTIARKVGEKEKLFGSVTNADIAECLEKGGFAVEKRQIHLPEPIKQLGVVTVPVRLTGDVTAQVKVWVVQEKE